MSNKLRWVLVLCLSVATTTAKAQTRAFPSDTWPSVDPRSGGWAMPTLDSAQALWRTLPPASVFIVERGRLVAAWGDPSQRIKVSSVRKSFLSALYGKPVRAHRIDLAKTIAQLHIDDNPPLTEMERSATIRDLLQSRSGVYHAYVGGTPDDRAKMPSRGSHAPGSFWYYNNWDFNALGTIFERLTARKIGDAFNEDIARPLQMEDFRRDDMYYFGGTAASRSVEQSIHPAYHFRMSARDLARFGYLFLAGGTWRDQAVVPAEWVAESTTSYSTTENGGGYGYLWWTNQFADVRVANYEAIGALGKYIIVVPSRDLVMVYLNHTEFPDDAAAVPAAEIARLPSATRAQVGQLLALVLRAQGPKAAP